MLMITVMAFATDYKGQLDFAIKISSDSYPASIAEGTLSITQYKNGNYQVTAKDFNIPDVANLGDIECDGLPGTTDANGVTTIDVTDCTAGFYDGPSWIDLSSTRLLVKFNNEKAYATFEGQYQVGVWRTVSYTFGVDDFESTGGGEPGGEDKPAIVDVVDADYAPNGTGFAFPFTINWETQKLVAKLDLSTCKSYTHNEGIITVGTNNGNGDVSLWNPNNGEANCHLYYTRYYYGTDEKVLGLHYLEKPSDEVVRVDKSLQNLEPGLVVFTFDKDGLHVGDNLIAGADQMTTLYNSTSLIFGSKEGSTRSYATYKYVKVVPADWTEPKEKYAVNFDKGAKSTNSGRVLNSFSLQQTGKEKQTESVSVSRAAYEDHTSKVFTVEAGREVTASFDYTGEWMNGYVYIDRDTDGEFSYTEGQWDQAGTDLVAYSFYTTLANPKVNDGNGYNSTGASVTGDARSNVNPPAFTAPTEPGTYRIRFKVDWNCILPGGSSDILTDGGGVWDATLNVVAAEPEVTVKEEKSFTDAISKVVGDVSEELGQAQVSIKEMTDETISMTLAIVGQEGAEYTASGFTKTVDTEKNRTTYTGSLNVGDNDFAVTALVYTDGVEKLYMVANGAEYNYVIGTNPDAPKVVSTLLFENVAYTTSYNSQGTANVTFTEMSDGTFPMTFASEYLNVNAENLTKGEDAKGRTTYTGTAKRTDVEVTFTVNAVVYGEAAAQKLYMTMDNGSGFIVTVGENPDAPEPEIEGTVVEGSKNYAANGSKFEWSNIAINWNKQKLVAVIDLSSCTGKNENILSVGQNIGSWRIGGWHFYYTKSENRMKSDYLTTGDAHPISDDNTPVEPGIVRIELSKAEGCTINGVSFNGFYDSNVTGTWQSNTADFWALTSVNIGSKEGDNRSNAVIKYVTVVDLPVTVKEEKTFNEALYMQDQKVADATVVVKEMSDETVNMSLTYTIGDSNVEYTSTELTKGTDAKGRTTYTGKVSKDSQTYDVAGVVYEKDNAERLYMTMTDTGGTLVVGENPDAVTPEVTEVSNKTYTSNLRIFDGEEPVVENAEAQVNIIKYSDDSYKVTLKDVTLNENTQDLVFVGTTPEEAPTAEAAEPLTINAKSDEATTAFFGEEMNGTFDITEVSDDEIKMEFAIEGEGVLYEGEFNYEAKTPAAEPFCKENYVADGNGFEWEIPVDWETQKIVMSIDPSTCTGNCEDVIGLGAVPTAWVNTLHLYRTRDQKLQGYFQVPGGSNNNTDKFAETVPFLVEVSKAQGFVVNDEVKIASSAMSYLFTLPTVKMGTGEGANDKSRATYNYVKVVDKDWTKDPETGINATTVAEGEFEVFSVDGVKLSKLQKGLNIVRSADGKVKKVLVK